MSKTKNFDITTKPSTKRRKATVKNRIKMASVDTAFVSLKDVCRITSLSSSTIYNMIKRGDFPQKIQISKNRVAFSKKDIDIWVSKIFKDQQHREFR